MTSAAARGRGGTRLGEKDAGLADPLRLLRGRPTGRDPRHLWGERGAGGCRGHGWRGGRSLAEAAGAPLGSNGHSGSRQGVPASSPEEAGAAVGGRTRTPALPLAALQGVGLWSPKSPFPARLPAPTPGAASPLLAMESAISDLEPRRKAPLPSLGPSPTPGLSLAVAPARSRGDQP